jgi:hypothetical protein
MDTAENTDKKQQQSLLPVNKGGDTECALDIDGNICSTDETITDMKKFIQIKGMKPPNDEVKLLTAVKDVLQCSSEKCVLNHGHFKHVANEKALEDSKDRLKPPGPANSTALLDNTNIDTVLRKLTKVHADENNLKNYHMKFQMIDFAGEPEPDKSKIKKDDEKTQWRISKGMRITPTELGRIDMVNDVIDKGYKTFCVVLNTDKRTNGGIHWFCIFCDFRRTPFTIEYFNSSGNNPVYQVHDWIVKTENRIKEKYKVKYFNSSKIRHQTQSETECGLYTIYYIWNRLNNIHPDKFNRTNINDSSMIEFRKRVFR